LASSIVTATFIDLGTIVTISRIAWGAGTHVAANVVNALLPATTIIDQTFVNINALVRISGVHSISRFAIASKTSSCIDT
jgi:hypothetical protein